MKMHMPGSAIRRFFFRGAAARPALLFVCATAIAAHASLLDSANAAYAANDARRAVGLYRRAALAGENPALCYFNCANAWFQLDSLPQSIVYYRAALVHAPDFFRGHFNLSIAYYNLDDAGSCIAEASRALEIEPDNARARLVLAAAYRKAGGLPQAVTAYEQVVAAHPEMEEPYIPLIELYRELDDPAQAVRWAEAYPETGGNAAYANILKADLYGQLGDLARESYALRASFELDGSNKWVCLRQVQTLEKMGNGLVALEEAKRGLELFPAFADLALAAGNLAFTNDRIDEAERYYAAAKTNGDPGGVVGLENVRLLRASRRGTDAPIAAPR
jgi:superkiller protein 3